MLAFKTEKGLKSIILYCLKQTPQNPCLCNEMKGIISVTNKT